MKSDEPVAAILLDLRRVFAKPGAKVCPGCGCTFIPAKSNQKWCNVNDCGYLFQSRKIRDEPLKLYRSAIGAWWSPPCSRSVAFDAGIANCPDFTTPKCSQCDEWIEFEDQVGGLDFCDPYDGHCIDCPYSEPCPCFDKDRLPYEHLEMPGVG